MLTAFQRVSHLSGSSWWRGQSGKGVGVHSGWTTVLSESIPSVCLVREVFSGLYVYLYCVRCARRGVVQRYRRGQPT